MLLIFSFPTAQIIVAGTSRIHKFASQPVSLFIIDIFLAKLLSKDLKLQIW